MELTLCTHTFIITIAPVDSSPLLLHRTFHAPQKPPSAPLRKVPVGWRPKKRHPAGQDNFSSISQAFSRYSKEKLRAPPPAAALPPARTELFQAALDVQQWWQLFAIFILANVFTAGLLFMRLAAEMSLTTPVL